MHKSEKLQTVHSSDPIYAALADYRLKEKCFDRLWDAMEQAENEAADSLGGRPYSLIPWRRYSAIGWSEIDRARDEFLSLPAANPKQIAIEYRDAKKRLGDCEKAKRAWDRKAGLTMRRQELDRARYEMDRALMKLARTKPKTPAGAAMILAYLKRDMAIGSHEWQEMAMGTLARALKAMDQTTKAAA